ncbi:MAG: glycosyltransferase family 2 protein [Candidatus Woesearchaeota archaeon]
MDIQNKALDLSIVIAAYNEEHNVSELYKKITNVMQKLIQKQKSEKNLEINSYEIIFVDDGSTDNTFYILQDLAEKDKNLRIIKFRKNFGQSAAWDAGFSYAKGKIIITMDADLQNDPEDIPKLLLEMKNKNLDVVSGWRFNRKDSFTKKFFSKLAKFFRNIIINDKIHDSGCSLKAYKSECLQDLELKGEMHRYITEILALKGYKIGEVKVNHLPRKFGKTKYNLIRLPKGFLDLLVVAFWQKYSARPIHLFGSFGILMTFFGFLTGIYLLYLKFFKAVPISNRPLLLLSILFVILGIQFIIFGLIADILIKLYYSGGKKNYSIEKIT